KAIRQTGFTCPQSVRRVGHMGPVWAWSCRPNGSVFGDRLRQVPGASESASQGRARSGDREAAVHAGCVVAGLVADQLVAAGMKGQGDPADRSGLDARAGSGAAGLGGFADAPRLVDLPVGPD